MFNNTLALTTKMRTIAAVLVAVPVLAMPSASFALVNNNGYERSSEALLATVNDAVCKPDFTVASTGFTVASTGTVQETAGSLRPPTSPSLGGPTMPPGSGQITGAEALLEPQDCQP